MTNLSLAELRVKSLGLKNPSDIDILMIANDMNAKVKFRDLTNCEAKITGVNNKAIISVSKKVRRVRQRYSIAHELGHWRMHRGREFQCRAEDIGSYKPYDELDAERVADKYAADLLMPEYMARPIIESLGAPHISNALIFSNMFRVSKVAGALRTVEFGRCESYLLSIPYVGRCWKRAHPDLPTGILARQNLHKKISDKKLSFNEDGNSQCNDENLYDWFDIEYDPDLFGNVQIHQSNNSDYLVSIDCSTRGTATALFDQVKRKYE